MNRTQLYEFLVLSHTLSFSSAAKQLFISQSTLSKHIAELENEIGTKLFYRNTRTTALTPAGKIFSADAVRLIKKEDKAFYRMRYEKISAKGTCRILCTQSALPDNTMDFLIRFRNKYKDIFLSLEIVSDDQIKDCMDEYDIIFSLYDFPETPSYQHSVLQNINASLVLPMQMSFRTLSNVRLSELENQTLILPFTENTFSPFLHILELTKKLTHDTIQTLDVSSIESALIYVNLGCGVTILPRHLERLIYKNSRIVYITDKHCVFSQHLYYNAGRNVETANLLFEEMTDFFHIESTLSL